MKIISNENEKINSRTAVALGNFDGVHLGHKKLIDLMKTIAKERKLVPSVFTFNYTFNKFKLGTTYSTLISKKQKESILEKLGVDLLYIVNFDEKLMTMSPEEFVKDILVEKLNASLIVVGFNFKFGYKAQGDIEYLKSVSQKYRFEVEIIPPVTKDNCIISSTYIRELIKQGQVLEAKEMLGRPYTMSGKVIHGKGRGKKLGFATANLKCDVDYIPPKYGVYKTITNYKGNKYLSITNIGSNPTFNDVGFSIETHIIDFDKDLYGEAIELEFLKFIRPEKRFETVENLMSQVKLDISNVKFDE